MPKISVIVPVYNTEKYIGRCIESILNQSYKELEVIVINDGSSDGSAEIIRKYAEDDSRIIFIDNKNCGVSESRNIGIRNAKGEYIQFVDSDDFIDENMLKDTLQLLEENNVSSWAKPSNSGITGRYFVCQAEAACTGGTGRDGPDPVMVTRRDRSS